MQTLRQFGRQQPGRDFGIIGYEVHQDFLVALRAPHVYLAVVQMVKFLAPDFIPFQAAYCLEKIDEGGIVGGI